MMECTAERHHRRWPSKVPATFLIAGALASGGHVGRIEGCERFAIAALKQGDTKALEALESFGKAMAVSLRDAAVILPYSRAQIFTKGWGGKYQAHHILEVAMARDVLDIGKKAADDIPAIILSEAEHKAFTKALEEARANFLKTTGKSVSKPHELWAIYKEVYKSRPTWLQSIESYFK